MLSRTVSMALRPAAFIVSPDSVDRRGLASGSDMIGFKMG